ncbi:hypothetical protein DM02DRAFT_731689 [Periconia macrospinosa]|uniref:Mid2 domain-containing protein n=1 Tax=Periconia macrospinosa TaxID=97972 RepID=A0A2V1DCH1_9PLEO|nr:hypothetical protein DM02DRAFT_731689 [Periconia macrospinosa]
MLAPTLLHFTLITLSFIQPSTATCYDYNGKAQDPEWQPCPNQSGSISTCCASNRQNPFGGAPDKNGQNSDRCLSNGLCQNQAVFSSGNVTSYFRNGCTAENPDDKWCLNKVCASNGNPDWGGAAEMTPCDGTPNSKLWCCGRTKSCCGTDSQWELPTTLGAAVPALGRIAATSSTSSTSSSSPTSSSPTSSPNTSPNSTPNPSQTPQDQPKSATSSSPVAPASTPEKQPTLAVGAIAGIVVACVVAVAAIIAIIFLKRRWDAKRKKLEDKVVKAREAQEVSQNATYEYWGHRLDTSSPPLEMSLNADRVHELDMSLYEEKVHELHSNATPHEIGLDAHQARVQEVKNMV